MLKDDESLKDVITDKEKLEERIGRLQDNKNKSPKELNLLGRLEFYKEIKIKLKIIKKQSKIFKTLNKLAMISKTIRQRVEQKTNKNKPPPQTKKNKK
ncbi:hypothetical protein B6658_009760 (plasmid) [Campylobacter coli]